MAANAARFQPQLDRSKSDRGPVRSRSDFDLIVAANGRGAGNYTIAKFQLQSVALRSNSGHGSTELRSEFDCHRALPRTIGARTGGCSGIGARKDHCAFKISADPIADCVRSNRTMDSGSASHMRAHDKVTQEIKIVCVYIPYVIISCALVREADLIVLFACVQAFDLQSCPAARELGTIGRNSTAVRSNSDFG